MKSEPGPHKKVAHTNEGHPGVPELGGGAGAGFEGGARVSSRGRRATSYSRSLPSLQHRSAPKYTM